MIQTHSVSQRLKVDFYPDLLKLAEQPFFKLHCSGSYGVALSTTRMKSFENQTRDIGFILKTDLNCHNYPNLSTPPCDQIFINNWGGSGLRSWPSDLCRSSGSPRRPRCHHTIGDNLILPLRLIKQIANVVGDLPLPCWFLDDVWHDLNKKFQGLNN
jgi:hypothetical protein